jgi:glutamate/tyrosine decarboxylase-like PLP-dependent enzyme
MRPGDAHRSHHWDETVPVDTPDWRGPLTAAVEAATDFLADLPTAHVGATATAAELRAALGGPLPAGPSDPVAVVRDLARAARPGLIANPGGRYFGFVIGGATPATLATDWLVSAWDQNAGLYGVAPAAAVVEEVAGAWLVELLGLPAATSVGFVTGAQMANFTGLAAARHHLLAEVGWDVEADGLTGAPPLRVLAGEQRHHSVDRALRFLGLGTSSVLPVQADEQGRIVPAALAAALSAQTGPVIVCAQAGEVNSGAIDPLGEVAAAVRGSGVPAWLHVDGAFGLWAAASPALRHLVDGIELADSWCTDAHKWLNVPYDSGLVFCAHPDAHRAAMGIRADYLVHGGYERRDPIDHNPEFSRRARGFAVYAAIRELGASGIAAMIERCCAHARAFAAALSAVPGVQVLNDVVLNQVLVRFTTGRGDAADDAHTRATIERVQADGTCWAGGTVWHGKVAMRISVTNWSTDDADVHRSVAAMRHASEVAATA